MNTPKQTPDYMLDTVALKIKYPDFKVTNPHFFSPSFDISRLKIINLPMGFKYWKCVQNPPKNDITIHKHPRLTGSMRLDDTGNRNFDLVIEFSVPKLLWAQSLQELADSDFERTVGILVSVLRMMGVEVTSETIRKAVVIRAHFGKNIPLPSPTTAQDALQKLYKADVGRSKHINMRHWDNDGQALYFYASSRNSIFYDKLRDIATPQNKAVDKDKFKQEKQMVLGSKNQPELLRYEVRFGSQQSLNAFLGDKTILARKVTSITFQEIFNRELCQKIVLKDWRDIVSGPTSQLALKMDKPTEEIFDAIIISYLSPGNKKAHSLNRALQDFAVYTLINKCGARKVRDRVERHWSKKSWQRLNTKMAKTAESLKMLPPDSTISDIQIALDKFEKYDWKP